MIKWEKMVRNQSAKGFTVNAVLTSASVFRVLRAQKTAKMGRLKDY